MMELHADIRDGSWPAGATCEPVGGGKRRVV